MRPGRGRLARSRVAPAGNDAVSSRSCWWRLAAIAPLGEAAGVSPRCPWCGPGAASFGWCQAQEALGPQAACCGVVVGLAAGSVRNRRR